MRLLTCILTENDCYKAGRTIKPKGVMVHSTGANNPLLRRYVQPVAATPGREELLAQLGVNANKNSWNQTRVYIYTDGTRTVGYRNYSKTWKQTLYEPCVHGFVGKLADGTVAAVQTLPWNHRAWHCGEGKKGSGNDTHISFEICEDGLTDPAYFAQVYQAAVELTAMLCGEYGLDPLADGVVICHSEGYRRGIASGHADVEHWFPRHGKSMNDFRADVAAEMKKEDDDGMDVSRFKELWLEMRKELQDNDSSAWSGEAREWAVNSGLVQGSDGDNYMWEDVLTREQVVTILYRFAQLMGKA